MTERTFDAQYDIGFDSQRFSTLLTTTVDPGFEERLAFEKAYTAQQLKTDIGERLDVAQSTYFFDIRDGKLFGDGEQVPFDQVIQKGMYRREIDWEREEAELTGHRVIEAIMVDPATPDGTIILNASPRGKEGSNYEKNYLDAFIKRGDRVEATRYLSEVCNAHYRQRLVNLNPMYGDIFPVVPSDVELKSTPVVVPGYLNSDPKSVVVSVLGREIGISSEEFDQIWLDVAPIWTSLINTLAETPDDIYTLEKMRKALYNASFKASKSENTIEKPAFGISKMEIIYLAEEKTQIGGGGCGGGTCSTGTNSKYEFGPRDEKGPLSFDCPSCGAENTRPYGGYVYKCKNEKCKNPESVLPNSLRNLLS
jgi:hypothetical protein